MYAEQLLEELPTGEKAKNKTVRHVVMGNRIPRGYFWTSGVGESDVIIHGGSYHLAVKEAGIECYNILHYTSIMPGIAVEVPRPQKYVHGAVLEAITATANVSKGEMATAAIILGWLYDRKTGMRYGGLVSEYNGSLPEKEAEKLLLMSLHEMFKSGFEDEYDLRDIKVVARSLMPEKKYGTAIVAICFTDYVYPVIG